ncbi:MAG: SdrD B-like domain-containing protein [Nocardioides sp.]
MNTARPARRQPSGFSTSIRFAMAAMITGAGLFAIPGTARAADNVTCPEIVTDIHIRTSIADTDFPNLWVNAQFGAPASFLNALTPPEPDDPRNDSYDFAAPLPDDISPVSTMFDSYRNKYQVWIDTVSAAGTTSSMDFRTGTVITIDGNEAITADMFSGDTDGDKILDPGETWTYLKDLGLSYTMAETSGGPIVRTDSGIAFTDANGDPLTCPGQTSKKDAADARPLPPYGQVGNLVWFDANGDGIQSVDEPGIPNVKLTIARADGGPVQTSDGLTYSQLTVFTDSQGNYSFPDLNAMFVDYVVTVESPVGYAPTVSGAGDPTTDSSKGSATSQTLSPGSAQDDTLDFGFIKAANQTATPAEPSLTATCGPNNDTVVLATTTGITYTAGTWSNNQLTVTAVWATGYVPPTPLPTGWTLTNNGASFTLTDKATPCAVVATPVAPTVTVTCGANNDTVVLATTTGITYTLGTWANNQLIVGAVWAPGYVPPTPLPTGWRVISAIGFYTVTDAATPCPIPVAPAAPEVAPECGADNDLVTLPETEGLSYSQSTWTQGELVVSASLDPGYIWPEQLTDGWIYDEETDTVQLTLVDAAEACPGVTSPEDPAVEVICDDNNDDVQPPLTAGVTYSVGAWEDGSLVVTAALAEGSEWTAELPAGWTLQDDGTATYTVSDANTACQAVSPSEGNSPDDEPDNGTSPESGNLPQTGVDAQTTGALFLGVLSLLAGVGLVAFSRRRRVTAG